ncbi:MAG: nucleotidyltransferase domain-containing protein, partial [Deltaproteobacteria bacterium]|nr:nucleotidyltransferase domain-containing protein [Deltaproteobacteria bacterium]
MVYSISEIIKIVSPIAKTHGVEKVWVFGSYARGEATSESDIDFRVD